MFAFAFKVAFELKTCLRILVSWETKETSRPALISAQRVVAPSADERDSRPENSRDEVTVA